MIRSIMKKQIEGALNTKEKLFYIGILLFSTKGYHAVGIREICREAGIKESSFYNHYRGKAILLESILDKFLQNYEEASYSKEEIEHIIEAKNIDDFIEFNMQKFARAYGFPMFHPTLLVVHMERFTNKKAHQIIKKTPYLKWKEPTLKILKGFIENGTIGAIDVDELTMEYYYALSGIVDNYMQLLVWGEDYMEASNRIQAHMEYYKNILKNSGGE